MQFNRVLHRARERYRELYETASRTAGCESRLAPCTT
jgi:hypothetical protein